MQVSSYGVCMGYRMILATCLSQVMQEFKIKHILNVTPKCPNHFEGEDFRYKRIAVSDTGSQKLSHYFQEAFEFIGKGGLALYTL